MKNARMKSQTSKKDKARKVVAAQPNAETAQPKDAVSEIASAEPVSETAQSVDSIAVGPTSESSRVVIPQSFPVESIALDRIVNSEFNPRKSFSEASLQELANSIAQVGVLQPICVRPKDEMFEIVYGERRYWAAVLANRTHIPAFVREMSDAEAEDAAITENL